MPHVVELSQPFQAIRFCRSLSNKRNWLLIGIEATVFDRICLRLFLSSATLVSTGCSVRNHLLWICFEGPTALLMQLASVFPAPQGRHPLFFSNKGQILVGAALQSVLKRKPAERLEAGIICQKISPSEIAKATK